MAYELPAKQYCMATASACGNRMQQLPHEARHASGGGSDSLHRFASRSLPDSHLTLETRNLMLGP